MTVAVLKLNIIEINLILKNKMTNSNIIIIVVTASICSTLGVFVLIRKTIQYTNRPVNTLVRPGDIQLEYIEPTRPQEIYNYPDLLEPQFITYDRLPSYHTVDHNDWLNYYTQDRWYIHSCLENSINLDYIWIFSMCFLILILILKFRMRIYCSKQRLLQSNK